jgi:FAD/FMN-containing dehydrogenase
VSAAGRDGARSVGLTRRQVVERGVVGAVVVAAGGCGGSGRPNATRRTQTAPPAPPHEPLPAKHKAALSPLRELAREVRGPVLRPRTSDALVYNERFSGRRPRAVVQPRDARDVQAVVRWAQRHGVALTARSGGHSYAGYSTTSDGVVLDLRRLRSVRVARGHVRVGGGAQLIDVHAQLARHGGMLPTGSCPSVGVGGLTQGGGMGLSGRAFGLTCDNVQALTIVTPDGRLRRCDARTEEDLFWACRGGGGGNFGIVTSFDFKPRAARRAAWFSLSWPWEQAGAALAAWQRVAPHATDALTSVLVLSAGGGRPQIHAIGQYFGRETQLRAHIRPLTAVAGASLSVGSAAQFALVKRWAGCAQIGRAACHTTGTAAGGRLARARFAAGSAYVERSLSADGRSAILAAVGRPHPGAGVLILDAYGGAINRKAPDATAFVHRSALFSVQILTYFGPQGLAAGLSWKRRVTRLLRHHVSGAAYQNYIDPDLQHWQRAYYGHNLPRLREIRATVDPENLLRFPQSIPLGRA